MRCEDTRHKTQVATPNGLALEAQGIFGDEFVLFPTEEQADHRLVVGMTGENDFSRVPIPCANALRSPQDSPREWRGCGRCGGEF
jgi:hypothetical protein